jgi:hypothetical protein
VAVGGWYKMNPESCKIRPQHQAVMRVAKDHILQRSCVNSLMRWECGPACHVGGRGFESRPLRQRSSKKAPLGALFCFLRVAAIHKTTIRHTGVRFACKRVPSEPKSTTTVNNSSEVSARQTRGLLRAVAMLNRRG